VSAARAAARGKARAKGASSGTTARADAVDWEALAREAEAMRAKAYAPYSGYRVGAALLARKGPRARPELFLGSNVENASYGLCLCAERVAVADAVRDGARDLVALAVATEGPEAGSPCGMCRQVLAEFARDLPVALVVRGRIAARTTLAELLPRAFHGAQVRAVRGRHSAG
jgi:cytidine deaminase